MASLVQWTQVAEDMIPSVAEKGVFPFVSNKADSLEREEIFPARSKGSFFSPYSSYVTVMHGCNNFCSYCIVPFVRGREISRKSSVILEEINKLVDSGIQEVTLLGLDIVGSVNKECNRIFALKFIIYLEGDMTNMDERI